MKYLKLTKLENEYVFIINDEILKKAGLDETTLFQITVFPSEGIVIQSISEEMQEDIQAYDEAKSRHIANGSKTISHDEMMERLGL